MTRDIVHVQPLHHDDDSTRLFVVKARHQSFWEPLIHIAAADLRPCLVATERVVEDNRVCAQPCQRSAYRGRVSTAALRRDQFVLGAFLKPRWAQIAIPIGLHKPAASGMKFGREIAGVAAADEPMRWIATQYKCNPGHRYDK